MRSPVPSTSLLVLPPGGVGCRGRAPRQLHSRQQREGAGSRDRGRECQPLAEGEERNFLPELSVKVKIISSVMKVKMVEAAF